MITRRTFLDWCWQAGLSSRLLLPSAQGESKEPRSLKYGPLREDPAGILALPKGFEYQVLSREGERMDDGFRVPSAFDGMGAFQGEGDRIRLVRNHELSPEDWRTQPFQADSPSLKRTHYFDGVAGKGIFPGGTTTLEYDPHSGTVVRQHLSLVGTIRNCSGGVTPWGTWISCEETTLDRQLGGDRDHGFCFEVDPRADTLQPPRLLPGLGRFRHEAAAIDPDSGFVYLTEDQVDGLFYRFRPGTPGNLAAPGQLEALVVKDKPGMNTRNLGGEWRQGQSRAIEWVAVDDVLDPRGDLRMRGKAAGAAVFCRGEGITSLEGGGIAFVTTTGGGHGDGQVWRVESAGTKEGQLSLMWEAPDASPLRRCDNMCVAASGDLIIAEDHSGGGNGLFGLTPRGHLYPIARNQANPSEVAGCCWSPDGSILFFNIFHPGITLAITGPW